MDRLCQLFKFYPMRPKYHNDWIQNIDNLKKYTNKYNIASFLLL